MPDAVRGAKINVEKLKAIIDAIEDNGPRDGNEELLQPYLKWVQTIKKDIALYEKWRKAAVGQKEVDSK